MLKNQVNKLTIQDINMLKIQVIKLKKKYTKRNLSGHNGLLYKGYTMYFFSTLIWSTIFPV